MKIEQPGSAAAADAPRRMRRLRRWVWRLGAMVGVPLLVLLLIEGALRAVGYGYETAFFLPGQVRGTNVLLNNPRYGWRFFPQSLAREPWPFALAVEKPRETVRVFVLGESAAMGDPDPRFGLPRMIEALLSQRYPERRFEVVNMAFTAINSHVLLPIANECARHDGDIWVVYMGHNEVVGPYGAGTVFGDQTPLRALIRANVALKTTRWGQWLQAGAERLRRTGDPPKEWEGMEMFLGQQVRRTDPRMSRVYAHFGSNLRQMVEVGLRAGVRIVLCTVGTNVRDCSPFASMHRADLAPGELAEWEQWFESGVRFQETQDWAAALAAFGRAAEVDGDYAELHFRMATCLRSLGKLDEAAVHYRRARDEDTLRFRADTRLNEMIREYATDLAGADVVLLDAEEVLARQSSDNLPGSEWFFEHVHLTPSANYQLALGIAGQVIALLPGLADDRRSTEGWADVEECEKWLGLTDRNRHTLFSLMMRRMSAPPFTHQLGHAADLRRLEDAQSEFRSSTRPTQVNRMAQEVEALVAARGSDPNLRSILAELLDLADKPVESEREWRTALELWPNGSNLWSSLGMMLQGSGQREKAIACYRRCLELSPWHAEARARLLELSTPVP